MSLLSLLSLLSLRSLLPSPPIHIPQNRDIPLHPEAPLLSPRGQAAGRREEAADQPAVVVEAEVVPAQNAARRTIPRGRMRNLVNLRDLVT